MPFDFLKRKKADGTQAAKPATPSKGAPGRGIPFDGLTEEWRIVGNMEIPGRLSDSLNKREAVTISDVQWAPVVDISRAVTRATRSTSSGSNEQASASWVGKMVAPG